jgi:superfamily II DNA or RNA helicase
MIIITKQGRWAVFAEPPPKKLEAALFNRLCYKRDGWQFMPNKAWAYVRFYNHKKAKFAWGLIDRARPILEQWTKFSGEEVKIISYNNLVFKHFTFNQKLREYQRDAIMALHLNNGGIISLPTGAGKTFTAIEFLSMTNFGKALVIVPTKDLQVQWENEIKNSQIIVHTYQYLTRHLEILKNQDIVIFDEVHHVAANTLYKIALLCNDACLVGLSATPFRAYEPEGMKIEAALGKIVYQISLHELIKQGYLCDADIIVQTMEYDKAIEDDWLSYPEIVDKYIVNNYERNELVVNTALEQNNTTLILVDKIEHGKILYDMLVNCNRVFVHGTSKDRRKIFDEIKAGKYKIIIATKIYGEGVNFPNLHNLILAGGGKSSVATVQKIGRILRLFDGKDKAHIFDFNDKIKYLDKHFEERLKIYEKDFEVYYGG